MRVELCSMMPSTRKFGGWAPCVQLKTLLTRLLGDFHSLDTRRTDTLAGSGAAIRYLRVLGEIEHRHVILTSHSRNLSLQSATTRAWITRLQDAQSASAHLTGRLNFKRTAPPIVSTVNLTEPLKIVFQQKITSDRLLIFSS